ncbi:hypothetical protein Tco_1454331 [Tanacetum coccineum]
MEESQSYLTDHKHRECYDRLIKSYDIDKSHFSTYDKVYLLKRSQKDEYKDEDPSAESDQGLKKRKTSKDIEPTTEEPEFEVADSYTPQDQEENLGNDDEEPKGKVASKRDWFTKPKRPQEPTNPDWYKGQTPQQGPTQSWLMTLASSADKPLKTFDKLMSSPIDFSACIMNDLKITNLTQETLLGLAFKLLKGTCSNYTKLEYDFEECYKALSKKLNWNNPEGGDYPFDLTKLLPLVMNGNRQMVLVDYFFNNDLKYLQGGISTMTYTTSITKTKATQYDIQGIQDMTFYGYTRGLESSHDVYFTKRILAVTRVEVMRKHGTTNVHQKHGYSKESRRSSTGSQKLPEEDQRHQAKNRLMRSDELYKFSDRTLTGLRTSMDDITKNIQMEYLPQRRWSTLEKKS